MMRLMVFLPSSERSPAIHFCHAPDAMLIARLVLRANIGISAPAVRMLEPRASKKSARAGAVSSRHERFICSSPWKAWRVAGETWPRTLLSFFCAVSACF